MKSLPFVGATGTVRRYLGESGWEVDTDLGVSCIVAHERDEFGERFVDVPANWLHTDEEKAAVVMQAQTAMDEYMRGASV